MGGKAQGKNIMKCRSGGREIKKRVEKQKRYTPGSKSGRRRSFRKPGKGKTLTREILDRGRYPPLLDEEHRLKNKKKPKEVKRE